MPIGHGKFAERSPARRPKASSIAGNIPVAVHYLVRKIYVFFKAVSLNKSLVREKEKEIIRQYDQAG